MKASAPRRFGRAAATLLCGLLALALAGCGRGTSQTAEPSASTPFTFRVVRPKQLVGLGVLEKQGTLAAHLKPLGVRVEWLEFAAGPQQLEALNAGGLDIASTAESPPVFAQAAGVDLVYLATTAPNGRSISLLVSPDSPIKQVADLKGKRVAFQKASIGHYLLVKALETAGLTLNDVEQVYLAPADANAAFSEKRVDAWFVWEPYATRAVADKIGRVLLDGGTLRDTGNFYTTTRAFLDHHADLLKIFLADLADADRWSGEHPREMAELLAPDILIDVPTLLEMHAKYTFGSRPITAEVEASQERVAQLWFKLGFLPAPAVVANGFLTPARYRDLWPTSP